MAEVPGCAGGQEATRSPAPGGEKSLEPAEGVGRQLRAPSAPRLRFILDGREKAGMLHADGLGTAGVRAVIHCYPLSS